MALKSENISNIKKLIDSFYKYCSKIDSNKNKRSEYQSIFLSDLIKYVSYLTISDGKIRKEEIDTINSLFYSYLTEEKINAFAESANLKSGKFEKTVPDSLKILCNYAEKTGNYQGVKDFIDLYSELGAAIVLSDGELALQEALDYKVYISTLKDYAMI